MASPDTTPPIPPADPVPTRRGWATLRELNRYQWFVFAVAAVAWMADCMDQQLFNLARMMSLTDLLGGAEAKREAVTEWAGWATSIFLVGWGAGGLVFGVYGDRIGRVRTLTLTILHVLDLHRVSAPSRSALTTTACTGS